ncbi:unnamed protein product [Penicillium bialowiezense]
MSNDTKLPIEVSSLLRIYFSQTHCWLPVVDKTDVMRSSYRFARQRLDTPSQTCGSFALLWAVTASTTSQLFKSGHLAEHLESENVSDELVSSYYAKARELIPSEEGPFEIEHVQALLLLILIKMNESSWSAAWILIGHAVRISISLNPTSLSGTADPHASRLHHKAILGCFILDTLVSFHLSRPPYLREQDVEKYGAIQEDGLDEWDHWSNPVSTTPSLQPQLGPMFTLSTFNRLVGICKTLQFILISQLSGTSFSRTRVVETLNKETTGNPFTNILKHPGSSYQPEEQFLPHHHHLRLVYLIAVAALSPQSNLVVGDEHPWTGHIGSVCASEIPKIMNGIRDKFGLNAIPQTYPLILAIASRSQLSIGNDLSVNPFRSPIHGPCPGEVRPINGPGSLALPSTREEDVEREQDIARRFPQRDPNDGELWQQDSLTDSNSVFNDFVAIDTFEWTSNWDEGLFNLGFTADSSTNDFYDFCEPGT